MKRLFATAFFAFTITTTASAAITGTVVDEDGAPLAGAVIRTFTPETPHAATLRILGGKPDREPAARAETAANGAFKIETGGAAAVTLGVSAPGRQFLEVEAADGDDLGTLMIATAKPRKLRVVADGKPVANAMVFAGTIWSGKSAEDGTVDVPLIVGVPARVTVMHRDYAPFGPTLVTPLSNDIKLTRGSDIRGRVLGVDQKTAVPHARIWIGNLSTAETGDDGTFTVAHVPPHWSTLRVSAASGAGVAANNESQSYTVTLRQPSSITGTVLEAKTRAAVAGMRVTLIPSNDVTMEVAITDAKGAFAFNGLPPSQYTLNGIHPAYQLETRPQVVLGAGLNETRALSVLPVARVRGTVIDEEKRPVGGVMITRGLSNEPSGRFAVTNARGEFMLSWPGVQTEIDLYAIKNGYAPASTRTKLIPGETTSGLTITLPRGIPLAVKVIDREKKPVSNAAVSLMLWRDDPFGSRITMSRCSGGSCVTSGEGTVEFRVTPGKYDVNVGGETIATKVVNGQMIDAKSSPFTVVVDRGAEVSGRVVTADGKPAADVSVTMTGGSEGPRSVTTDASGTFAFKNAASGPATLQASLTRGSKLTSAKKEIKAPAANVVITMPRGGTITGHVIDDATRAPVTDFQVSTMHAGIMGSPIPVQSNDGTFTLNDIAPGPTDVQVAARGYASASARGIEVEEGKAANDVEISLERGATVKGRVTSDGQPIEAATIFVDDAGRRTPGLNTGREGSDANGNYALEGVTPGTRTVTFNKSGFIAQRKTIEAASGKEVTLDVALERGRELHGKVIDESGQPVAMADVRVEAELTPPARTDGDGSFTLAGLRDTHVRVVARKTGYVEARLEDVDPAGPPLTLTLRRGGTITGHISGVTDAELASIIVNASGSGSGSNARPDSSGNFKMQGVADGRFTVQAQMMGGQSRHSVRKSVEVIDGSAPPVELSFSEGFTMRGHVTSHGQPLGGVSVSFTPADATIGSGSSAVADADGSYMVSGLSAGDFNVIVSSPTYGATFNDKTTVSSNGIYDIDVRASAVRGHVVDAKSGAPLADAQISFTPAGGQRSMVMPRPAMTDFTGRFAADFVPERKWRLRVQREKYETAFIDVEVGPGTPEVEARLEPASSVTVRIVDAGNGAPVPNAFVVAFDANNKSVFNGQSHEDGTVQLWVAPGRYTVNVSAQRYSTGRATTDVPGPVVQISLERAGRIVVASPNPARVRLTGPLGAAPPGAGGTVTPSIGSVNGRFESVRPGNYVIELLSPDSKVLQSKQIVVVSGQTTTVTF